ncbi:hypothetical protein TMatcc_003372 [Talaromyces marneffei ATCC 18224]
MPYTHCDVISTSELSHFDPTSHHHIIATAFALIASIRSGGGCASVDPFPCRTSRDLWKIFKIRIDFRAASTITAVP